MTWMRLLPELSKNMFSKTYFCWVSFEISLACNYHRFKMVHALPWCWTSIESFHFSKGLGRQGACEYGVVDLALHIGAPIHKLLTCPEVPNLLQSFAVAKLVK
jgi:hypothetical protein